MSLWTLSFSDWCIDSRYLVIAFSHTILNQSFWNFAHVFSWVCRSACGLDMIFKFIFVTFSALTLSFSYLRFYESVQTEGTFSEPNYSCIIWENVYAFDEINIIISSTWNKHYFYVCVLGGGGEQVQHQLHWSLIYFYWNIYFGIWQFCCS